jgi:hypothetical protein
MPKLNKQFTQHSSSKQGKAKPAQQHKQDVAQATCDCMCMHAAVYCSTSKNVLTSLRPHQTWLSQGTTEVPDNPKTLYLSELPCDQDDLWQLMKVQFAAPPRNEAYRTWLLYSEHKDQHNIQKPAG